MGHVGPVQQIAASHRECNDVKGHADRLRQVQREANGAPDVQPERPGNHVIGPASFDLLVGGDFRHSEGGGHRHQMAHEHNHQRGHQADVGHSVPETQEQNRPQNGGDGRQKHRPRAHRFEVFLRGHRRPFSLGFHLTTACTGMWSLMKKPLTMTSSTHVQVVSNPFT